MGLDSLVRKAVAIADKQTKSLQVTVTHEAWTGADSVYGAPTFAAPISRLAIVEDKEVLRDQGAGSLILQRAAIYFLRPIEPNGAVGRNEPIDTRDRITLSDGYTGPILTVGGANEQSRTGLVDPVTGYPYLFEVILG